MDADDFLPVTRQQALTPAALTVDPMLQQNIDAFCAQLDGLLQQHAGKYVVYANSKLVEICGTLASALSLGYEKFSSGSFMVQRVEPLRSHIDFQATCRV